MQPDLLPWPQSIVDWVCNPYPGDPGGPDGDGSA
jgi:hypothetical protein